MQFIRTIRITNIWLPNLGVNIRRNWKESGTLATIGEIGDGCKRKAGVQMRAGLVIGASHMMTTRLWGKSLVSVRCEIHPMEMSHFKRLCNN